MARSTAFAEKAKGRFFSSSPFRHAPKVYNLIQAYISCYFLAGDYAFFQNPGITYEYIDKTIRSAIITLIYNMANLSFRGTWRLNGMVRMMKQIQEQTALNPLHSHWRLADDRNVLYLSPTG